MLYSIVSQGLCDGSSDDQVGVQQPFDQFHFSLTRHYCRHHRLTDNEWREIVGQEMASRTIPAGSRHPADLPIEK